MIDMSLKPKLMVPAIPYNGGIRFLMVDDQIDIGSEFADEVWNIIELSNGYNSIEYIVNSVGCESQTAQKIVDDLFKLGIMCDSREQYKFFHELSSSPDIYSRDVSYEEVMELQRMPRICKEGKLIPYVKDNDSNLSQLIFERRSCRRFSDKKLTCNLISNICYHAYSIQKHCVPSGGALYPLSLYVIVCSDQIDLCSGYYQYDSIKEQLILYQDIVDIQQLKYCYNDLDLPFGSSVQFVITADIHRESRKYSNRGYRLTLLEAGHVAQNINLYCQENKIGCCELGGVLDYELEKELELNGDLPLITIAVGFPGDNDFENTVDYMSIESVLSEKYVGENKPIKSYGGRYLGKDSSFFGAYANFGQDNDYSGATSSSIVMAKSKAIIEGIERYVSEHPKWDIMSSAKKIKGDIVSPERFLPTSKKLIKTSQVLTEYNEDLVIPWKKGYFLNDTKNVFVPCDLVYYGDFNDDYNRICFSTSSGVAAHFTEEEAIKNALLELVERDAIMRSWYEQCKPFKLCDDILPVHIKKRVSSLRKRNRKVYVLELETSYIPTFLTVIIGEQIPYFVCGAATGLDIEEAIGKSFDEAEYSFLSFLKDTPQVVSYKEICTPLDHGRFYAFEDNNGLIDWLWTDNIVKRQLPVIKLTYKELVDVLNPIVINMFDDGLIKVTRVISDKLLPICFGDSLSLHDHPLMKELVMSDNLDNCPHYFA